MRIETVYKSGFAVVVVVLATTAAYLQARGAARILEAALLGSAHVAAPTVPASPATAGPSASQPAMRVTAADGSDSDPLSWPDCEGIQALIVSESKDPWWSLSTLRWPGEERGRLRRVGDSVGSKQVAFIGYNPQQLVPAVWLTGDGTSCQSPLFRPPAPAELRVDRTLVDETLREPMAPLRSVRVVPEQKDGATIGLRLFSIRPDSLLAHVGLQNGDRLESINGFSLTSPEQALQAYARLRTASKLTVRLNRRGKLVEITVTIV